MISILSVIKGLSLKRVVKIVVRREVTRAIEKVLRKL